MTADEATAGSDGGANPAEAGPPLDSGLCPLCDAEFRDRELFRHHLAAEHGLEDDEGTETDFIPPLFPSAAPSEPEPQPVAAPAAASRTPAPAAAVAEDDDERRVPIAVVLVAVLLLAVVGGAMVLSGGGGDDKGLAVTDSVVETTVATSVDTTPTSLASLDGVAPAPEPAADASTTPAVGGLHAPAAPPAFEATPIAEEPPAPEPPVSDPPVSEVPTPPAVFSPPTTAGAKVDSCQRDKGRWIVTYRWQYVGGTSWSPLSSYTALGGGWYQHTLSVKNGSTITAVLVADPNGVQYTVALAPSVSTASC